MSFLYQGLQDIFSELPPMYLLPGVGNNAFSIEDIPLRDSLAVSPWEISSYKEIDVSDRVVFQDKDENSEILFLQQWTGLKANAFINDLPCPSFIIDNHNQAFFAWYLSKKTMEWRKKAVLIHFDAHYDDREALTYSGVNEQDWRSVYIYTHEVLQVATFIKPALHFNWFKDVIWRVESKEFQNTITFDLSHYRDHTVIVDIDLDLFMNEMSHIPYETKMQQVLEALSFADVVTFASSPAFIDQKVAVKLFKEICELWIASS